MIAATSTGRAILTTSSRTRTSWVAGFPIHGVASYALGITPYPDGWVIIFIIENSLGVSTTYFFGYWDTDTAHYYLALLSGTHTNEKLFGGEFFNFFLKNFRVFP